MNKIFNWTFGSIFRTLGRVLCYLLVGALFGLILSKNNIKITDLLGIERVNASTSIGIYSGYNGYSGSCSDSGYFNYDKLGPNLQGEISWSRGAINTAISGKAKNISLAFKYDLSANKTYDVTITFYGSDLTNKLKVSNFSVYKTLGCGDGRDYNDSTLNLVSFTNKATSSSNTNKLKFRISTLAVVGDWEVQLRGGNDYITSVSNFGIKSVIIDEVDTSGNNQIIENNTNNTNNIINNQNQNTQDIIDNQNNLLGTKCGNLLEPNMATVTVNGVTVKNNGDGTFTINGTSTAETGFRLDQSTYLGADNLKVYSKGTYTLSINQMKSGMEFVLMEFNNWSNNYKLQNSNTSRTITLNNGMSNAFLYIMLPNNTTFSNYVIKPMFAEGTNKNFCKYGSFVSKQDETTNAINNLDESINSDDSSEAQSKASEFFGNFTTNTHGLTGIITAPLNAIQSLSSSSCSPLVLPLPFVNQNLTLPCMRQIYVDNFGAFMTIYDVITLGIVSYWILVRIFALVKDFKNPDHDEIEVMDL